MNIYQLEKIITAKLRSETINDYVPNGLQIEGNENIGKIVTGVTASLALIHRAIDGGANTLIVHHGYFWKNESPLLTGMKGRRIRLLFENNINLLAYHLPLDLHEVLGNNIQLAKKWSINNVAPLDKDNSHSLVLTGELATPLTAEELKKLIHESLGRLPFHCGDNAPKMIRRVAWCSGAAQDALEDVAEKGFDAYITGEVSERTIHIAREMGIHFFAAGHHATERYGVKALGDWLAKTYPLEVEFIDVDNPI